MQAYKKVHTDWKDTDQILDLILTQNTTQVRIPDNLNLQGQKVLTPILAKWEYIEPSDFVNQQYPGNPIWAYAAPNCGEPIYFKNNVTPLPSWDSYHTYEFKSIKIYCDLARTWNTTGNEIPLLCRLFKTNINQDLTSNSFSFTPTFPDIDKIKVPSHQQYLTLTTTIEVENLGNIRDPSDPKQIKWQTITEQPLFNDNTKNPIQPQPNFNRPLYLRLKINYIQ